jgi:hypothetical protein
VPNVDVFGIVLWWLVVELERVKDFSIAVDYIEEFGVGLLACSNVGISDTLNAMYTLRMRKARLDAAPILLSIGLVIRDEDDVKNVILPL